MVLEKLSSVRASNSVFAGPSLQLAIASSSGLLLKVAGLKVTAIKIDPYMNVDAGTMRPTEHSEYCPKLSWSYVLNNVLVGEVYVLNDGGEVDLDLGNYELYLDVTLSRDNNITIGRISTSYREKGTVCIHASISFREE